MHWLMQSIKHNTAFFVYTLWLNQVIMHEWCFFPYIHIARQNVVLSLNFIKRLQKSKCSLCQSCQSNYNNIIIFLSNEDQYIEFCKCNWNKLSIPGRVLCFQSTAMSIDLNHFPKKRSYIYIRPLIEGKLEYNIDLKSQNTHLVLAFLFSGSFLHLSFMFCLPLRLILK